MDKILQPNVNLKFVNNFYQCLTIISIVVCDIFYNNIVYCGSLSKNTIGYLKSKKKKYILLLNVDGY